MSFYRFNDAISAQCQATGAWLQFGPNIIGWCRLDYRERGVHRPLWFGLRIWAPISQNGMREAFGLHAGRARLTYTTRGETHPGHYCWDDHGWRFRLLPKRRRAVDGGRA